jgi:hypothetical protein
MYNIRKARPTSVSQLMVYVFIYFSFPICKKKKKRVSRLNYCVNGMTTGQQSKPGNNRNSQIEIPRNRNSQNLVLSINAKARQPENQAESLGRKCTGVVVERVVPPTARAS